WMLKKALPIFLLVVVATACSSASTEPAGHENPERAVVSLFEAIDSGNAVGASVSVNEDSLALILGIENGLDAAAMASYLEDGVPLDLQAAYWASFAEGFVEFASRPISTLTVGESNHFTSEGIEFAGVSVTGGNGGESVVIARAVEDGSWEVDLVASLGDGFVQLLSREYDALPHDEAGDRIRTAYKEIVVPSLWAAMSEGSYGDDFTRVALALIERVGG
ncbi:MAG: hypothetical protein ABFR95_11870, partial [Actinomycetota bacterium]